MKPLPNKVIIESNMSDVYLPKVPKESIWNVKTGFTVKMFLQWKCSKVTKGIE